MPLCKKAGLYKLDDTFYLHFTLSTIFKKELTFLNYPSISCFILWQHMLFISASLVVVS